MTSESAPASAALIFAFDEPTRRIGEQLIQIADERARLMICNAGQALRLIFRSKPAAVLVCAAEPPRLAESAAMIGVLHERRPDLPLLAVAGRHEESIERSVRSAGAGYYFALDSESERRLLSRALESLGFLPPVLSDHPPPRSRGQPIRSVSH